jgi:NitT/TauT family transport system ATP-binding protein
MGWSSTTSGASSALRSRRAYSRTWGLGGHEHDFPHALSGGMRQRVGIARAFAIEPANPLCDEPFSALDEVTGSSLRSEFLQLVRETKATGIFITHSINEALALGHRVLVFGRPARIAYAAALPDSLGAAEREDIRAATLRTLSGDVAA